MNSDSKGTFIPNKSEPIHGWYPYIEGYSSKLVQDELDKLVLKPGATVFDPFGGTGTTPLSACMRGLRGWYCETNPFMRFVIGVKTNTVARIAGNKDKLKKLEMLPSMIDAYKNKSVVSGEDYPSVLSSYYQEDVLDALAVIKAAIQHVDDRDLYDIATLALSSILVSTSKMIRRGDLRFARESELKKKNYDVDNQFFGKLAKMAQEIQKYGHLISQPSNCLSADVRDIDCTKKVDCIITSPPYLNGTNYFRNTKLELLFNGYVPQELGLSDFHSRGIVAGINNVSKSTSAKACPRAAQEYYEALLPVAYDKRVPKMVAAYFYDMNNAIEKMHGILAFGGMLVMDIGDSQFAGIHIPTHDILIHLANDHDFRLVDNEILRSRRSKNGMVLTQRILRFEHGK